MFAMFRNTGSRWSAFALTLALLMGLGQVAHFASHTTEAHSEADLSIDFEAAFVPFDAEVGLGLYTCEHQHNHEGSSISPVLTATLLPSLRAAPIVFDVALVHYDSADAPLAVQWERAGPDRPPRHNA